MNWSILPLMAKLKESLGFLLPFLDMEDLKVVEAAVVLRLNCC